ncbi:MAG: methionine synthase [Propionibacteriaceae bacterium]|nr:methionine synthase [Propionibacteriaceae bacterium]
MASYAAALGHRLLLADGGMGTQLLLHTFTDDDFGGHPGCFELLNLSRPEVISSIHRAYFEAGADAVETNTFSANLTALGEYGIEGRIFEMAQAGARLARQVADEFTDRYVLGSMGPGTKLPSLRQVRFAALRDGYQQQAEGLLSGGVDAFQIETCQDLLQAKAAVLGARRAMVALGVEVPIQVSVTFETNGTLLLGTDASAALVSLEALGIDAIGLNCGTGPEPMAEQLRYLSEHTALPLSCMPNAGLPELTAAGAVYPLGPEDFATQVVGYAQRFGLGVVGGCCDTTPAHIAQLKRQLGAVGLPDRTEPATESEAAVSSLYSAVELRQDVSYLSIGERTNANGSKAFREALLAEDWAACLDIAKDLSAAGAHVLDLCVDYVGRDSAADMDELAAVIATGVPLPVMLDSTDPAVLRAGLERLGGRCIVNSVSFEDGDGPDSRFAQVASLAREHGAAILALTIDTEGQARTTARKVEVAERLIARLRELGFADADIFLDCLTFPITTGQAETRLDARATLNAIAQLAARHPQAHFALGVSNVSFGLNPAARQVLNSVFLAEAVAVGLSAAIVNPAGIIPTDRIPQLQLEAAQNLIEGKPGALETFIELFEGVTLADRKAAQAEELAALDVCARLRRRIVLGAPDGLAADLEAALAVKPALEIINEELLAGMKQVGELFGAGQMQLPFVLASAEVMKAAVELLRPHLDARAESQRGTLVLATVAGDVHDIGKNLVDIILSNNGFKVVNLGIKQPISAIAAAAKEVDADAIGLSGLLVKSTQVMRNDLLWLNEAGLADIPVLLGGAALTRAYVEGELQGLFDGRVCYAKDAFEGLRLLEELTQAGLPATGSAAPRVSAAAPVDKPVTVAARSAVPRHVPVPTPPFLGRQLAHGIALDEVAAWLDLKALFAGQWGLKPGADGPSYAELVETEGWPRLNRWLDYLQTEDLVDFSVYYGFYECFSAGEELRLLDGPVFAFPRQADGKRLCIADYFRDAAEVASAGPDVLGVQLVSVGAPLTVAVRNLYGQDRYRDYLELNGLAAQLAEALAEYWHARMREMLGINAGDGNLEAILRHQRYQGERYSFGYPACPDLAGREVVFQLLRPTGIELTENLQLDPEFSTDAIIAHHPEARYFSVR